MWKLVLIFCVVLCSTCSSSDAVEKVQIAAQGGAEIGTKIVGGTGADVSKFPFAAQLISNRAVFCGGTVLTSRHILTAAHCIVNDYNVVLSPKVITVRVGATRANSGGTSRSLSAIMKHELYDIRVSHDNDIAILLLSRAVSFGSTVAAAAIPPPGFIVPVDASVTVVGWGTMSSGMLADNLQEVTVSAVNHTMCAQQYQQQSLMVTDRMLCAGRLGYTGYDSCQGDSGGPLIYQNIVVGVTSWGIGCGHPLYPGVYASVSSYSNWIQITVAVSSAFSVKIGMMSILAPVFVFLIQKQL